MLLDRRQDRAGIGRAHEDVGAAVGQQRKRTDARRVGHRRHHQMNRRRLDRHGGPEDPVHGLDHAVGDLHALGPPRRAARADQDRDLVRRIGQIGRRAVEPRPASPRNTGASRQRKVLIFGQASRRRGR